MYLHPYNCKRVFKALVNWWYLDNSIKIPSSFFCIIVHSFTHETVQPLWRHCWRILNCAFHFYRETHQNPIWLVWEWYCSVQVNIKRDSRTFYLFCLEPHLRVFVIQTFFNVTHWYDSCVTNYDNMIDVNHFSQPSCIVF